MSIENIITLVMSGITILTGAISYYFYIKNKIITLSIDAINVAEESDKVAEEKMAIAIQEIVKLLPAGARLIFTEKQIEKLVQFAFDGIELFAQKQINKNK